VTPAEFRFPLPVGDDLVVRPGAVVAVVSGDHDAQGEVARQFAARAAGGAGPGAVGPRYAWIDRRRGLAPALDIAENIFMGHERRRTKGLFRRGIDWARTRDDAGALLTRLGSTLRSVDSAGGLGEFDRLTVEIARAEAREAAVIALDEPTSRLREGEAARMTSLLRALADRGAAVLVFTERPAEAMDFADEIVVARRGDVVGVHPREEWGGVAGPAFDGVRGRVLAQLVGPTDARAAASSIEELVAPRESTAAFGPVDASASRPELLRIEGWSTFDPVDPERPLVSDAGFAVGAGEIVGLAGLRDAGSESLLLSVYGRSEGTGTTGSVTVEGRAVDTSTVEKSIAAGLFLATTSSSRYRVRFVGGIAMPVSASRLPALVSLGLVDRDSDTAPRDGMGDKVLGAARALGRGGDEAGHVRGLVAAFPDSDRRVLLLVEPLVGSSEAQSDEIRAGLRAARAAGKAVVVASADLGELFGLCDRVVTMAEGRVTGEVRPGADPAAVGALLAPL
jgi:ABC-type sugar transport system ATPase subunit